MYNISFGERQREERDWVLSEGWDLVRTLVRIVRVGPGFYCKRMSYFCYAEQLLCIHGVVLLSHWQAGFSSVCLLPALKCDRRPVWRFVTSKVRINGMILVKTDWCHGACLIPTCAIDVLRVSPFTISSCYHSLTLLFTYLSTKWHITNECGNGTQMPVFRVCFSSDLWTCWQPYSCYRGGWVDWQHIGPGWKQWKGCVLC